MDRKKSDGFAAGSTVFDGYLSATQFMSYMGQAAAAPMMPAGMPASQLPKEQEVAMLENQAKMLEQQLDQIKKRLEELMK